MLLMSAVEPGETKLWSLEDFNFWITHHSGIVYAYHHVEGLYISKDYGNTWADITQGLPHKVVYPFDTNEIRRLTCLYLDPLNPRRVLVSTSSELYLSCNYGKNWEKIPLDQPVSRVVTIKSCALASEDADRIAIGTGFNGLYETKDRGLTWTDHSNKLGPLKQGLGFYEEISSLAYDPEKNDRIYFSAGFGKGVYLLDLTENKLVDLDFSGRSMSIPIVEMAFRPQPKPIGEELAKIRGLSSDPPGETPEIVNEPPVFEALHPEPGFGWILQASSYYNAYTYSPEQQNWRVAPRNPVRKMGLEILTEGKKARLEKSAEKYGIYVSAYHGGDKSRLKNHLKLVKDRGMNSIVVDMKDEYGIVCYDSKVDKALEIDSIDKRLDVKELLKTCHDQGIYVIGRIVVFKDKYLYNYMDNKYAAWDKTTDKAWFNGKEYWLDPFCQWIWEYNASLAVELEGLGIDEIQFDYIRFPTDGYVRNIIYRFEKQGQARSDALESFLRVVQEKVSIPIGTDVYGFNGWFHMGNWMGQDIPMLSEYVDVIQPMNYPNHFALDFLKWMTYTDRANYIQKEGTRRTAMLGNYNIVVRPYMQAFLMNIYGEMSMTPQEYEFFLDTQAKGALDGHASGFTFWNASNNYYMIANDLSPYIKEYEENKAMRIPF
ncbi:MAG: hypothetical protein JXR70_00150 [Spirochaetales bacterium]|nr:hypothetical protein [Spirochaetales bacterium]